MLRLLIIVTLLASGAWASPSKAASFDCARAGQRVERLICGDPTLSELDDLMNTVYRSHERESTEDESIVMDAKVLQAQKRWIAVRDACRDAACLEARYEERIDALAPCPSGRRGTDPLCLAMVDQAEHALQRVERRAEARLAKDFAEYTNAEDYIAATLEALREAEKTWRAFRDAECAFEPLRQGMSFGYSADITVRCKLEMTRARKRGLIAVLRDDDGSASSPSTR